jgi:CRISPR type I-E-associated protein CasB/Cse2
MNSFNALIDKWVLMSNGEKKKKFSVKEIFCGKTRGWQVVYPLDALDQSTFNILCAIGHFVLAPKTEHEWDWHKLNPLTEEEYDKRIRGWEDSFDLNHPEHPLMQRRMKDAGTYSMSMQWPFSTIQNGSWFCRPDDYRQICPGCAISFLGLMDFFMATGGYQGAAVSEDALRVTIHDDDLRVRVVKNTLITKTRVSQFGEISVKTTFNWVESAPVWARRHLPNLEGTKNSEIRVLPENVATHVLLLNGAHAVELQTGEEGICDCCGEHHEYLYTGIEAVRSTTAEYEELYTKANFNGLPRYPYAIKQTKKKKDETVELFLRTPKNRTLWQKLPDLLKDKGADCPVLKQNGTQKGACDVVLQGISKDGKVVGTQVLQAFNLPSGWVESAYHEALVEFRKIVGNVSERLKKAIPAGIDKPTRKNLCSRAENLFFRYLESEIKQLLIAVPSYGGDNAELFKKTWGVSKGKALEVYEQLISPLTANHRELFIQYVKGKTNIDACYYTRTRTHMVKPINQRVWGASVEIAKRYADTSTGERAQIKNALLQPHSLRGQEIYHKFLPGDPELRTDARWQNVISMLPFVTPIMTLGKTKEGKPIPPVTLGEALAKAPQIKADRIRELLSVPHPSDLMLLRRVISHAGSTKVHWPTLAVQLFNWGQETKLDLAEQFFHQRYQKTVAGKQTKKEQKSGKPNKSSKGGN